MKRNGLLWIFEFLFDFFLRLTELLDQWSLKGRRVIEFELFRLFPSYATSVSKECKEGTDLGEDL